MAERPILFSAPMVRAILAGTKTQTRRLVKPQPQRVDGGVPFGNAPAWAHAEPGSAVMRCPYGKRGDRLWVRESGAKLAMRAPDDPAQPFIFRHDAPETPDMGRYWVQRTRAPGASYSRECSRAEFLRSPGAKVVPSIHMPRWASRITLEITGVRVERLEDISADDARAEGCPDKPVPGAEQASVDALAKLWYFELWERINGPGSWSANHWVWVVEFKRVEPAHG